MAEFEITDGVFVDVKITNAQAERLKRGESVTLNIFPDAEMRRYAVEDMGFTAPNCVHIDSINHPNPAVDDKKFADSLRNVIKHERNWKCRDGAVDLNYGDTAREVDESLDTGFDAVDRPSHYAEGRRYEPIDVIEDWGLGMHLGNATKYISRAGRKGDELEDLKKARWYIDRRISLLEDEE